MAILLQGIALGRQVQSSELFIALNSCGDLIGGLVKGDVVKLFVNSISYAISTGSMVLTQWHWLNGIDSELGVRIVKSSGPDPFELQRTRTLKLSGNFETHYKRNIRKLLELGGGSLLNERRSRAFCLDHLHVHL